MAERFYRFAESENAPRIELTAECGCPIIPVYWSITYGNRYPLSVTGVPVRGASYSSRAGL